MFLDTTEVVGNNRLKPFPTTSYGRMRGRGLARLSRNLYIAIAYKVPFGVDADAQHGPSLYRFSNLKGKLKYLF